MTRGIRPLVAGNWKMNGASEQLAEIKTIASEFQGPIYAETDAILCLPATLIERGVKSAHASGLKIGGQNCHAEVSGAHTGDISAEMLRDAGAKYVIVGHSERRIDHGETDERVRGKASAAHRAGLTAIICIGETGAERDAGETFKVLARQIAGSVPQNARATNTAIAYEPVWAIGTGVTPTNDDVAKAHAHIRAELAKVVEGEAATMRILYGGSVKPSNAKELLALQDVDGALVGGASLKAADFIAIANAYLKR